MHGPSPPVLRQLASVQAVLCQLAPAIVALLSCELQAAAAAAAGAGQKVQPVMAAYLHSRPLLCSTAAFEPGAHWQPDAPGQALPQRTWAVGGHPAITCLQN